MRQTNIKFIRHKKPESVVFSYFRDDHPRMSEDRLKLVKTDFQLNRNNKKIDSCTIGELIDAVKTIERWGYCLHKSKKEKEIHYWIGKNATLEQIIELMSHEIAHSSGYRSERAATKFGGIAAFAYHIISSDLKFLIRREIAKKDK